MALYRIEEGARVSRAELGTHLGLGSGAVKSLISKLHDSRLLKTSKSGNALSEEGREIVRRLRSAVPIVSAVPVRLISTGRKNVAAVVRGVDAKKLKPVTIRDEAVRAGGSGATTLFFDGKSISVPEVYDDLARVSGFDARALSRLGLRKGDVIVVAGGDSLQAASLACVTAVVGLFSN
ncbi:MAG: hypothetical protein JTT11_02440 [Candidatus Brockarchaeota archaeon]|nr:hypothetical protein [Candidatus Brockarchaeota archaeon]